VEPLRDDARFVAEETVMIDNIIVERDAPGLELFEPLNQL